MLPPRSDIPNLKDWLVRAGLDGVPASDLLAELGRRMNDAGLGIGRIYMAMTTLHPMLRATGYTFQKGSPVIALTEFRYSDLSGQAWHVSPFAHMIDKRIPRMRRRLIGPSAALDFPVLQEFADQGLTDWAAAILGFRLTPDREPGDPLGIVISVASDLPGGWSPEQFETIESLLPHLGVAVQGRILAELASSLLGIYLGQDAAQRVLGGTTRRGDVRTIQAAILYADFRGFTSLSETIPPEELIDVLDRHFECVVTPIEAHSGQVLKFMGDGLLAIFPTEPEGPQRACAQAYAAAQSAQDALSAMASAGGVCLKLDVALHLGEVLYGNVGSDTRLDFTVIGSTVNEAARMEGLCEAEAVQLVLSRPFVEAIDIDNPAIRFIGPRRLPGIAGQRDIFTVATSWPLP